MMRALITVLDGITETSMPFNEFVVYRSKQYPKEQQIIIVCNSKENCAAVCIPENIQVFYTSRKLSCVRKTLKNVLNNCKEKNISYVVHAHQVKSALLAQVAMLGTGMRKHTLFTVHNTFSGYKFHNKVLSMANAMLANRTTCVSNVSYQGYPRLVKRIKGGRIQALQNGVDTKRIDSIISIAEEKPMRDTVDFIYVARIVPVKNHPFLIDVLQKTDPSVRFIFVGQEDAEQVIRKKAEQAQVLDRVVFTGLIPRNEVFKRLKQADFYISSSVLEGLPVSVLEAMYCGLPCVLSDIPQHKETIGLTMNPGDTPAHLKVLPLQVALWAQEVNALALASREERKQLAEKSRTYINEHFTLEIMHEKYDGLYDLLDTKS